MKYHVLYNPAAGNGKNEELANKLSNLFADHKELCDITTITDYAAFFSSFENDDVLVLCGGDGTINRFVNDTDGLSVPCEILYLATGTGNDFLHDIEHTDKDKPVNITTYLKDLPLVEVKGKRYRFLNNVGFGIDGYCCEVGDELKKKSDKPVNYTAIAIKGLLFGYKPSGATVTVDGKEYRYEKVWIAPTMKGRYYGGGMIPTPDQDRNDPEKTLSLMLMHGTGKLKTLTVFPSIFKGGHIKHTKMVALHTGKNITVTFDKPAAVQIDGETILGVTSYHAVATADLFTETSNATV